MDADEMEMARETLREAAAGGQSMWTAKLQKRFQCGFNRAAAIMERLEGEGFVSEPDTSGKRRLLKHE